MTSSSKSEHERMSMTQLCCVSSPYTYHQTRRNLSLGREEEKILEYLPPKKQSITHDSAIDCSGGLSNDLEKCERKSRFEELCWSQEPPLEIEANLRRPKRSRRSSYGMRQNELPFAVLFTFALAPLCNHGNKTCSWKTSTCDRN